MIVFIIDRFNIFTSSLSSSTHSIMILFLFFIALFVTKSNTSRVLLRASRPRRISSCPPRKTQWSALLCYYCSFIYVSHSYTSLWCFSAMRKFVKNDCLRYSLFSEEFLKIFEKCFIDDYCSMLFYDDLRVGTILYR